MTQTSIKVRNGYKIDLPDGESCFWFEMDHPRERVPDFQTIFEDIKKFIMFFFFF